MRVIKLHEAGYDYALYGVSLSFNADMAKMPARADKLAPMDGGHNKFLEHVLTWWEVSASRGWWQQEATYRMASRQSESTMHTILRRELTQSDFSRPIYPPTLERLNKLILDRDEERLHAELPEGFLQTRECLYSYKTLRNMLAQRRNHKRVEWRTFCERVLEQVSNPEWLGVAK